MSKKKEAKKTGQASIKDKLPSEMDVHYIKTNSYRTFHVDGIYGGITPNGKIYAELFIQRSATPKLVKHKVTDSGLGDVISKEGKSGMIREIEAGIIMDMDVAITFRDWLNTKVEQFDKAIKLIEDEKLNEK